MTKDTILEIYDEMLAKEAEQSGITEDPANA